MEEILLYFALKYKGDFESIYHALKTKEKVKKECLEEVKANNKFKYTTAISKDYPDYLKSMVCPPFVLFYMGDKELLKSDNFIIDVHENGTRRFRAKENNKKLIAYESAEVLQECFNEAVFEVLGGLINA